MMSMFDRDFTNLMEILNEPVHEITNNVPF